MSSKPDYVWKTSGNTWRERKLVFEGRPESPKKRSFKITSVLGCVFVYKCFCVFLCVCVSLCVYVFLCLCVFACVFVFMCLYDFVLGVLHVFAFLCV